jgi:histidinol-phosphate aminotransferase
VALGDPEIMGFLNKVKYPYNLNILSQEKALEMLADPDSKDKWVQQILDEKKKLIPALEGLEFVLKVFPSDANFLLLKVDDPDALYETLKSEGVIVRNRSRLPLCEGCLRITVGTKEENARLMDLLRNWNQI